MRSGRPRSGGGTSIETTRTRARTPKANAASAAAETLAAKAGVQGQVFSLFGGPVETADIAGAVGGDASPVVLDWYRAREANRDA